MPSPRGVKPLVLHEKEYAAAIKKRVVDPMFQDIRRGLATAIASSEAFHAINEASAKATRRGIPEALIRQQLNRLGTYHRKRLIDSFRRALAIDIRPILTEPLIREFMADRIEENVRLIKTIPERFHNDLVVALQGELETRPFDQKRLSGLLRKEYGSTGYNVRRITRDQTTKTIGGLTEIRHKQAGIAGYIWRTSGDESVRPTHAANNGRFFLWASPPLATGHPGTEIQCRCTPEPVVRKADKVRLQREIREKAATKAPKAPAMAPSA